jgi:hypothetical protein
MGNILTYIKWRGDLTFQERPFCEVDNLVFSMLSYTDFNEVVPGTGEGGDIALEHAVKQYLRIHSKDEQGGNQVTELLELMASSRRYKNILLSNYEDIFDKETRTEFSAVHISLPDGTIYVAFRGTSDYIMGWREDFSMSFQIMGAQKEAARYLNDTMTDEGQRYRVGGHSKGGNLAVYAALMCPPEKQLQIMEIYNNDGPGLCPDIIDLDSYHEISPKIIRIVPEFSVIGALFEQGKPDRIVASSVSGIGAHDGMTWEVENDVFCTKEELTKQCVVYNDIFDRWIESASMEQRQAFTKDFFNALEAGGSKTLAQLSKGGIDEFEVVLLSIIGSESRTKIVIGKLVKSYLQTLQNVRLKEVIKEKKTIQAVLIQIAGFILVALPVFASRILGAGVGIAVLFWFGKRQLDFLEPTKESDSVGKPILRKKEQIILNMAGMVLVTFLIAQKSILMHFSNIILGGFFLVVAYKFVKKAFCSKRIMVRGCCMIIGILFILYGLVPLITAGYVMEYYMMSAGSVIFLYGLWRVFRSLYENGRKNGER